MKTRTFMQMSIVFCIFAGCGDDDGTGPGGDGEQSVATSLAVAPANATITALDASLELSAVVRDQNGAELQEEVEWSSLDESVATVGSDGLVTAVGEGVARVTATSGALADTATITVAQEPAAIKVDPGELLLGQGDTVRITARVVDANGHPLSDAVAPVWSSGDEGVATIDGEGLVTVAGDARGRRTQLTAAFGTISGFVQLSVMDRLMFVSDRTGNNDIYVMNADGSARRNLSRNPASDTLPAWSPDGSSIAFISDRATLTEIFVMDANGDGLVNVTDNGLLEEHVTWRNANRVVYAGVTPIRHDRDILSVRADGTGYNELIIQPDDQLNPRVSPDGQFVAFESHGATGPEIYVLDVPANTMTQLTNNTGEANRNPQWSPDGSRIAFESTRDNNSEIYVMDADGSNEINLSNRYQTDEEPTWSPDGTRLAFVAHRDGQKEIYVMNADGSGQTNLTMDPGDDDSPAWSPDGSMIAFVSDRTGDRQVYVMMADGSGQTALTEQTGSSPLWQPRSN